MSKKKGGRGRSEEVRDGSEEKGESLKIQSNPLRTSIPIKKKRNTIPPKTEKQTNKHIRTTTTKTEQNKNNPS